MRIKSLAFSRVFNFMNKSSFITASKRGVFFAVLGFSLFAAGDVGRKYLMQDHSVFQVMLWSNLAGLILCLLLSKKMGGVQSLWHVQQPYLHMIKAVITFFLIYCAILAIKYTDLTTFYTIMFFAPLLTALGGTILFKEHMHRYHIIALALGFVGVLMAVRPGFAVVDFGVLMSLATCLLFTVNNLCSKYFVPNSPRLPFGVFPYILVTVFSAIVTFDMPLDFTPMQWGVLILSGGASVLATISMVTAFQNAPAATVAPYHYTQIVWGVVFGYILFSDIPHVLTIIGSAVIIGAGLYLFHQDYKYSGKK